MQNRDLTFAHSALLAMKQLIRARRSSGTSLGYALGRRLISAAEGAAIGAGAKRDLDKLAAMDAIIAQCEARFRRHVKLLDHPILGALTSPQWRTLHLVHGRHHQKQLLRLRKHTLETR